MGFNFGIDSVNGGKYNNTCTSSLPVRKRAHLANIVRAISRIAMRVVDGNSIRAIHLILASSSSIAL